MSVNPSTDPQLPSPGPDSNTTVGAVAALVLGILLAGAGFLALLGGAAATAFLARQGPDGYLGTPAREFSAASHALRTPAIRLGTESLPFSPGTLRLAAESTAPGGEVFIGVGPAGEVEGYLRGIHATVVTGVETSPFRYRSVDVPGSGTPAAPAEQGFWIASASGQGLQQVDVDLRTGEWVAVLMNPGAEPRVSANLQVAVRSDLFGAVAPVLWIAGAVAALVGSALVVLGAVALGRRMESAGTPRAGETNALRAYPARLTGRMDPRPSRWLWLLKWLLVIPHAAILFFLWFALSITTIVSGFAVLFTGRYPRPLFNFAVGVLRWNWRVSFYSYSALGTDTYPPFGLGPTSGHGAEGSTTNAAGTAAFPADFEVDYPQRLSRGLVLVKWWLLALPHLVIVAVFAGGAWASSTGSGPSAGWNVAGFSLLGILVLVAALALLFTGRYPRSLFDLVMGINRWIYRVLTYVLLLRDDYPPFRLDQGPEDPAGARGVSGPPPAPPEDVPRPGTPQPEAAGHGTTGDGTSGQEDLGPDAPEPGAPPRGTPVQDASAQVPSPHRAASHRAPRQPQL